MRGIVFCKSLNKGNAELINLSEKYKMMNIKSELRMRKEGNVLMCDNGDYWKVTKANIHACGSRCNVAYIERTISVYEYLQFIAPALTDFPFSAIHLWGEGNLHIDDCPEEIRDEEERRLNYLKMLDGVHMKGG